MRTSLWKLKRSLNNLAFRMSFIRLAPGSSRPLLPIAEFIIVGFTVFVLSGGLFVLTQGGQGLLNVASGYSFVYPGDINNQTTQEAVFTTLIYVMRNPGPLWNPPGLSIRRFFIGHYSAIRSALVAKREALPCRFRIRIRSSSTKSQSRSSDLAAAGLSTIPGYKRCRIVSHSDVRSHYATR